MELRKQWSWCATLVAVGLSAGCEPEALTEYRYAAYEGEAYPDQRAELELPSGGVGLVTDSLSDTVSMVDLATGKRVASFPVGRDPVGRDGPHHLAVDDVGGAVYVALSYPVVGGSGPLASLRRAVRRSPRR